MTQFWNWIVIWSSIHEPVLIYGSSYRSVFKSPLYLVHSEHESGSGPGLASGPYRCSTRPNTQLHKHRHIDMIIHTYPNIHTYRYIPVHQHNTYMYIHLYTYIHAYTHVYIVKHTYIHIYIYIYTTYTHNCTHILPYFS